MIRQLCYSVLEPRRPAGADLFATQVERPSGRCHWHS
ncbi:hypothetical protein ACVJMZ_002134 [Sinorhizobium medicae]